VKCSDCAHFFSLSVGGWQNQYVPLPDLDQEKNALSEVNRVLRIGPRSTVVGPAAFALAMVPARRSASDIAFVVRGYVAFQRAVFHGLSATTAQTYFDISSVYGRSSTANSAYPNARTDQFSVRSFPAVSAGRSADRVIDAFGCFASLAVVKHRFHESKYASFLSLIKYW